jgi:hypothetical protein
MPQPASFMFRHGWIVFIAVTVINACVARFRVRHFIRERPELASGYERLFWGTLISGNLGWILWDFRSKQITFVVCSRILGRATETHRLCVVLFGFRRVDPRFLLDFLFGRRGVSSKTSRVYALPGSDQDDRKIAVLRNGFV